MTGMLVSAANTREMNVEDPTLNRQEGEYIELDYRDLEAFILGELDPKHNQTRLRDYKEATSDLYGDAYEAKDYSLYKEVQEVREYSPKEISAEPLVKEVSVRDIASQINSLRTFSLDDLRGEYTCTQAPIYLSKDVIVSEIVTAGTKSSVHSSLTSPIVTIHEITTQPMVVRELVSPALTVSVVRDSRTKGESLSDLDLSVDEQIVRKALGLQANHQQEECSVPLSLPIQTEDWAPQPESLPNSFNQSLHGLVPESVSNLELDTIGLDLTSGDSSIIFNDYRQSDILHRSFNSEVIARGPTVSSLVNIGNLNSESINSKLSSVNFDTESTGSLSDTSGSTSGGRKSRDEKIICEMGIPFSSELIINCSMDEFNTMLVSSNLTEEQINTCRDIRRRGKNKIAAQNCRKRKVDQITVLAEEVDAVRQRKNRLLDERDALVRSQHDWTNRLARLEAFILSKLGREVSNWSLEVIGATNQITLVPKSVR